MVTEIRPSGSGGYYGYHSHTQQAMQLAQQVGDYSSAAALGSGHINPDTYIHEWQRRYSSGVAKHSLQGTAVEPTPKKPKFKSNKKLLLLT